MSEQATTISVGVDSSGVTVAAANLDKMVASGTKAEGSVARLIKAAQEFSSGLKEGASQAVSDYKKTLEAAGQSGVKLSADLEKAAASAKKTGDETASAAQKITGGLGAVDNSIKNFVIGFASVAAVTAVVSKELEKFNKTIDGLARLDDQAQSLGETVESISSLNAVAKITGVSFDTVGASLARLTKGLAGNDEETKGAAFALKQLGIESRDAEGKLRSSVEITKEATKVLGNAADSTNKTAYAQAIYGKGAAEIVPYLNDLAKANLDVVSATTAQAKAATDYRDAQGALALETTKLYGTIAGEVLPVLTDVINAFIASKNEAGSLSSTIKGLADEGSLRTWAQGTVVFAAQSVDALLQLREEFKRLGLDIQGLAFGAKGVFDLVAAGAARAAGAVGDSLVLSQSASDNFAKSREKFAASEAGLGKSFTTTADAARASIEASNRLAIGYNAAKDGAVKLADSSAGASVVLKAFKGRLDDGGASAKAVSDQFLAVARSIQELQSAQTKTEFKIQVDSIDAAIDALNRLRAAGVDSAEIINQVAQLQASKFAAIGKGIDAERAVIQDAIDKTVQAAQKADAANDRKASVAASNAYRTELAKLLPLQERENQLAIQRAKNVGDVADNYSKLQAQIQAQVDGFAKLNQIQEDALRSAKEAGEDILRNAGIEVEGLKLQGELIGLTTAQQVKLRKEKEIQAQITLKQIELERILKSIQDQGEGGQVSAETVGKIAKLQSEIDALYKTAQSVPGALADQTTLNESIQRWKNASDEITNWVFSGFKNTGALIRKVFKDLLLQPTIQPIIGQLQGGISSLLGSALQGGGGGGGFLGSLFSGGSGGGFLGAAPFVNGAGPIAAGSGFLGSLSSVFGGFLNGGLSGGLGAIGAGVSGGVSSIAGGSILSGLGSIAGALGPIAIAVAAIAAVWKPLFGRTLKDSGIEAQISGSSVTGRTFDFYKGGFFRSDKTTYSALSSDITDSLERARDTIFGTLRGYAKALNADASSLATFSSSFNFSTKGLNDEQIKKKLAEEFEKIAKNAGQSINFDAVDKSFSEQVKSFAGTGEELLKFIESAAQLKPVIDSLSGSFPKLTLSLGSVLKLTDTQKKELSVIAAVSPALGQDVGKLGRESYVAQTRGIVNSFIAQGDALDKLVEKYGSGTASIEELANATGAFGDSAISVIAKLQEAKAAIDDIISGGVRSIELAGLSPEEANRYLSAEAERFRSQIGVSTDPEAIQKLVNSIVGNSTSVFNGLDPADQQARREEFIGQLNVLREEAKARIAEIEKVVQSNSTSRMEEVSKVIESAVAKYSEAAQTTTDAAKAINSGGTKLENAADSIADTFGRGVTIRRETSEVGGF